MLKKFSTMETFLTATRERSLSKASAKLGVSQPAVTQKIKAIEKHLLCKVIERKKSGLTLTSEGEDLYKIAIRLEKEIKDAEKSILKIINKKLTFKLGASYTIGTYIIPGDCLNSMCVSIDNDVNLSIDHSDVLTQKIKDGKLDVGLIESPIMDNDLIYREWLEDEFVLVSNVPIPKIIHIEDLQGYRWILREDSSHTRRIISEVFEDIGVSCNNLHAINEVSNTTVLLQMLKKSKKDKDKPIISVVSKYAITDEVINGELFEARIRGHKMTRKFFVVFSKENKQNAYVTNVVDHILKGRY